MQPGVQFFNAGRIPVKDNNKYFEEIYMASNFKEEQDLTYALLFTRT